MKHKIERNESTVPIARTAWHREFLRENVVPDLEQEQRNELTKEQEKANEKTMTRRQLTWHSMSNQRAIGPQWLQQSPFDEFQEYVGQTETEAAYRLDNKRVFRAMWAKT